MLLQIEQVLSEIGITPSPVMTAEQNIWVDVFSSHSDSTEAEDSYVDAQITLMLGRYASQIDRVEVYLLADETQTQTQTQPQFQCTIGVGLKGYNAVEANEVASKASDAINACAHRTM